MKARKARGHQSFDLNTEKNTAECISRAKEHYDLVRHYWQKVRLADRASCAHKARELVKLVREDSVEAHPYVYIDLAGCLSSAFCKRQAAPLCRLSSDTLARFRPAPAVRGGNGGNWPLGSAASAPRHQSNPTAADPVGASSHRPRHWSGKDPRPPRVPAEKKGDGTGKARAPERPLRRPKRGVSRGQLGSLTTARSSSHELANRVERFGRSLDRPTVRPRQNVKQRQFARHRLLAEATRRAVSTWAEGQASSGEG